jgi:hypothetical protein
MSLYESLFEALTGRAGAPVIGARKAAASGP